MKVISYIKEKIQRRLSLSLIIGVKEEFEYIPVSPPENLLEEDRRFFPSTIKFKFKDNCKTLANIFITRSGIILKHFRPLGESLHRDYPSHVIHCFKYALVSYFLRKKKYLKDGEYLLIYNHWCPGYYHWITEALPRLWNVKSKIENLILILPASYKGAVLESLEPFNFKSIEYVSQHTNLQVETLVLPPNPSSCEQYNPIIIEDIRTFYHSFLKEFNKSATTFGDKIYISREKAKSRKVANEEEVLNLMAQHGFVKVNFEDLSFWDQVSIMMNAKFAVSIHGAGLTNIQFMNKGGSILELQKSPINIRDFYSSVYHTYASVLGIKYFYQLCEPQILSASLFEADITVNIGVLEKNINLMITA